MFTNLKGKFLLLLTSAIPLSAMAHTGHDHQSQWAFLIHLLWLAPAIFTAYMTINFFKNKKRQNNK